jgi:predicted dehydrogenase
MGSQSTPDRRQFLAAAGKTALAAGLAAAALGAAAEPLAPPDRQPPDLELPPPPPKKRVGYAIVGLGDLALKQILPAFPLCELSAPASLVSGHRDKAERVAAHYGIDPRNIYDYQNYELIRDNPAIDAVYIVLPNSMHREYTERAFAAGKHVLCEKSMAPSSADCQAMIDAGNRAGKKLMIAYRLHYEPYNKLAMAIARRGELGDVRVFSAENLQTTKAPNIRLSKATAGGPLGDVGIYCLNAARYMVGEEPTEVFGTAVHDPNDDRFREVPSRVLFSLRFPSGVLAQCACGFDSTRSSWFKLTGTKGSIRLDTAYHYYGQRLFVEKEETDPAAQDAGATEPRSETQIATQSRDHFQAEMDHFSHCILNDGEPATTGAEGLADQRVLDAINRSIDSGGWVKVA